VLYGTGAVGVLPGRFETIAQSKKRARSDGISQTARRISATWFLERENAPAYEACAKLAEQSTDEAILAGLDAMQAWSGADHLAAIDAKTLVIWGDGDRTYPWAQTQLLWDTIRDAALAVVPGCAHAVHLEKPAMFNSLVLDHLSSS
jgi:pimeloyl-ACP methyl ester carboxylesterase